MKRIVYALSVVTITVLLQSCDSKDRKAKSASDQLLPTRTLTLEEKRAQNEERLHAQTQRRQLDLQARIRTTPFYTDNEKNIIFYKAEVDPSFVGGEKALDKYLKDNIHYPKRAERDGLEGTIFVDFIVGVSGKIREIVVSDMPGEEADQSLRDEAHRVVSNMPVWNPGRQQGKAVDVAFSLPITFRMM